MNSLLEVADGNTGVWSDSSRGAGYTVENTVFYGLGSGTGVAISTGPAPTVQYSDFFDLRQEVCSSSGCADVSGSNGNFTGDPRFTDEAAGDWTLDAFSPCIDAGNPAAAYDDKDGSRNDVGPTGGPYGL